MNLEKVTVGITDWGHISPSKHPGESGTALVRSRQFGDIQLRLVDYSAGYCADHWCSKGHLVYVVAGELSIEHQGGPEYALSAGMSYHVGEGGDSSHRLVSESGATVFIVD